MSRTYSSPLREDHVQVTRERILTAAHRLLGTTRPVDLSFAQVAEEAGVAVRTMYRHFPTADALFLALSDRLLGMMGAPPPGAVPTVEQALAMLRQQFEMMEQDPALFRVTFAVPTRSRGGGNELLETLLTPFLPPLSSRGRQRVFAMIDLLCSPYAWDVFHANWGLGGAEAWRASRNGIYAVVDLAHRHPDFLEADLPPFAPPPLEPT